MLFHWCVASIVHNGKSVIIHAFSFWLFSGFFIPVSFIFNRLIIKLIDVVFLVFILCAPQWIMFSHYRSPYSFQYFFLLSLFLSLASHFMYIKPVDIIPAISMSLNTIFFPFFRLENLCYYVFRLTSSPLSYPCDLFSNMLLIQSIFLFSYCILLVAGFTFHAFI